MWNTREIAGEYRLSRWAQVIKERIASGLYIKAYCEREGLPAKRYFYWQRKLRESVLSAANEVSQVNVPQGWAELYPQNVAAANQITVEVGNCRITVTKDTDTELFLKVCRALKNV